MAAAWEPLHCSNYVTDSVPGGYTIKGCLNPPVVRNHGAGVLNRVDLKPGGAEESAEGSTPACRDHSDCRLKEFRTVFKSGSEFFYAAVGLFHYKNSILRAWSWRLGQSAYLENLAVQLAVYLYATGRTILKVVCPGLVSTISRYPLCSCKIP